MPIANCAGSLNSPELQDPHQLLGEMSAHPVREDRQPGPDVRSGLEGPPRLAILPHATVARPDTNHALAVEQHRLAGEAPEEIHTFGFHLFRQPLREVVERNDVVAVVPKRRRCDGQPQLPSGGEVVDVVLAHLAGQGGSPGLEVRYQLRERGRIEQGARQLVRAGFSRLLDHRDRKRIAALRFLELRQPQSRRQPRRAAADDQDVYFESLSFASQAPGLRRLAPRAYFFSSAINAGAISKRSPTIP